MIPNTPFVEILRPAPTVRGRDTSADFLRLERPAVRNLVPLKRRARPRIGSRFAATLVALLARIR